MFALVLSLLWWVNELRRTETKQPEIARDTPDTYAVNLQVKQYDREGRLQQILQTPRMNHYEKRDITELSQPKVRRFRPGQPAWRMQGEKAIADHRQETLFIPGRVVIERTAKGDYSPYHIVTEDLMIHTADDYAETSKPVRIDSAEDRISAIGLQVWFEEPSRVKLLNRVRGHYEFR
jgi:lipopolysaccharide export system protein LptC